jgi:hypothetical protein
MLVQERKGTVAVDGMRAVVPFDLRCVWHTKHCVAAPNLCKLPRNPVVEPNAIIVSPLYHEGAGRNTHCHLTVIEPAMSSEAIEFCLSQLAKTMLTGRTCFQDPNPASPIHQ